MSFPKKFPTTTSGRIPNDPYGRTFAELDHWYKQQGTSLRKQCARLLGDPVQQKKAELLQLARKGASRPRTTSKNSYERSLAYALKGYCRATSVMYDAEFNCEIRRLRPDWFFKRCNRELVIQTKKRLLAMERDSAKPSMTAVTESERRLARFLNNHARKNGDKVFNRRIRRRHPAWFTTTQARSKRNKHELLQLAKTGGENPSRKAEDAHERSLAWTLRTATSCKNPRYDKEFDTKIRGLAPGWFKKR